MGLTWKFHVFSYLAMYRRSLRLFVHLCIRFCCFLLNCGSLFVRTEAVIAFFCFEAHSNECVAFVLWLTRERDSLCGLVQSMPPKSPNSTIADSYITLSLSHQLVKFLAVFSWMCTWNCCHQKPFVQPKMQQISLSGRALPRPTGGAYYASPDL